MTHPYEPPTVPRHLAVKTGEHPSYSVHESIDKTMRESKGDIRQLTVVEKNFLRAYEFDSRFLNEGLEGFFQYVDEPWMWQETADALRAVGAEKWASTLSDLLTNERDVLTPENIDEGALDLDEYETELNASKPDMQYMERLLDAYVLREYPWPVA